MPAATKAAGMNWQRLHDSCLKVFYHRAKVFIEAAETHDVIAALHNHPDSGVECQDELDEFMERCPGAFLLLDLGHLHGAGGDIISTIERCHKRIAVEHDDHTDQSTKQLKTDIEFTRKLL